MEKTANAPGMLSRNFGLEMEYADVIKSSVTLPKGYSWNKEARTLNTDATVSRSMACPGGKINTPPLRLCSETRSQLKELLRDLADNGAYPGRDMALHVHLDASDLEAEELKRVFFLSFHLSGLLKEMMHLPPYSDSTELRPSPDLDFYRRVKETSDLSSLSKAFESNSSKGWKRHMINISSCFVRGTLEFRLFNSTLDYEKLMACILFCYRFLAFALAREEGEYRGITSEDELRRRLKIRGEFPALPQMLICAAPPEKEDALNRFHRALKPSRPMTGLLARSTGGYLSCVNPQIYQTELRLCKSKTIRVYNNDEYHHILWLLARGELRLNYFGQGEFLSPYATGDPVDQLACVLVLRRLGHLFGGSEYARTLLESYLSSMDATMERARQAAALLQRFLEGCDYRLGTLNDAIRDGGEILFGFDDYRKCHSTMAKLRRVTDYSGSFQKKSVFYRGIPQEIPSGTRLYLFSENAWLPMEKLGMLSGRYLYCSAPGKGHLNCRIRRALPAAFTPPADDIRIDDPALLKARMVAPALFSQVQGEYVKKVERLSAPSFCFLVTYGEFLLGGVGFEFPMRKGYDLWMLSDFSTNNRVPRLSKLILLVATGKEVQRKISRRMHQGKESCYTKVYTRAAVSMKYRGVFRKEAREGSALLYAATMGASGEAEQIIEKYRKYLKA